MKDIRFVFSGLYRNNRNIILFFNLKLTIKPLGLTVKLANNYTPGGNLYDEAKYDLNYYE